MTDLFFHFRVKQINRLNEKKNVGRGIFYPSVVDWMEADVNADFWSTVRKRRVLSDSMIEEILPFHQKI